MGPMTKLQRSLPAAILAALGACAGTGLDPAPVRVGVFLDAEPALIFEAAGPRVRAVCLPGVAGRIVHYSLDGENILWNNPDAEGKDRPAGGYGLDLGPEMRGIPPHRTIWNAAHRWGLLGNGIATVSSDADLALGMKVEKQIALDARTGALEIVQRMRNISGTEQSYCIWDRTLCKSGGWTLIPLNRASRFPARWVLGKRLSPAKWQYDGVSPSHPNMKVIGDLLVVRSIGPEQKVGADSDAGWIAYARGRLLFVKYFPYEPEGNYTDGGLSVAHYYNERIAELEPISPEVKLAPSSDYVFPERWLLIPLDREPANAEEAARLARLVPSSPF
jgi:hypothetical protein